MKKTKGAWLFFAAIFITLAVIGIFQGITLLPTHPEAGASLFIDAIIIFVVSAATYLGIKKLSSMKAEIEKE
ncbi:MAG: hypothetical protein UU65_C0002G0190 [candidate division CPR2 bacterium GW2011_GWC1_41_48]|uniref:Uncharacterized protein n=1 Tax=candidate division CPR2 bacterium GW2011_GWC1_41_48 TaxID=1618344 RepID=A0A0G0WBG9_UNCC2|nr:MAG: hypothetical protein UT47_C0002G0114 [candidate division CPR2 bacterium GW2011_GWC2_39_35]KKR27951.1 MAG: hypothetical protein UT60_C0031G0002 [candidate division CPR2 bacterium GW2011_GWD2_39_7]KKS09412.1 MAG: hypothetical protein UU65_C0002G0190 [candidate division CPR2 bacterium GW2011_GWC1_41_48]OGB72063.1 MAG: hypothetical protein A2Y26_01870 [candidate division CPR2 bacterium GWD2_39_7]